MLFDVSTGSPVFFAAVLRTGATGHATGVHEDRTTAGAVRFEARAERLPGPTMPAEPPTTRNGLLRWTEAEVLRDGNLGRAFVTVCPD